MINQEKLYALDMSKNETAIYLILIEYGSLSAGIISKKIRLNRTTTYQVLDRMMLKGLVSYMSKGKRRIFQASSPERLLEVQQEKVNLAKDLMPDLQKLKTHIEEEVTIYKGRKGIRVVMNEILNYKEYVSFGSGGQFLDIMKHDFIRFQKEKKKRKIKSRVIIGFSSRSRRIVKEGYATYRFVADKYMTPTTTWVYGNKVAIVVWLVTPLATVMRSQDVAKAYRSYFELLWKTAKT